MSKYFRLLKADEIECRVSQCTEKGVSLLLYKTARTDADILDETVGVNRWENDFRELLGGLYGGLGVDYAGDGHFIWKWDTGTESNTEAEKGRASDAFKRAGFKHGIGRELYTAPFIWVGADKCNIKTDGRGKPKCNDNFEVTAINYDDDERICGLVISVKGKEIYRWGKVKNAAPTKIPKPEPTKASAPEQAPPKIVVPEAPAPAPKPQDDVIALTNPPTCADCAAIIENTVTKNGSEMSAQTIARNSIKRYGRPLCPDCITKLKGENNA